MPADAVLDDCRLLDDLHLSSITVGQLVGQAARALGVSVVQHAANFATATLRELAEGLDEMAGAPSGDAPAMAEGAAAWARCFAVELDEQPRPAPRPPRPRDGDLAGGLAGNRTGEARPAAGPSGQWQVFAGSGHPFAAPLAEELRRAGIGPGILVCLPPRCAEADLATALRGAKAAVDLPEGGRFVLVQHGRGAAGLAKTLRSEAPWLHVTVVHAPVVPQAVGWILAEAAATTGFTEAHYDDQGVRRVPSLRAMPVRPGRTRPPLTGSDVILVTGGGKGITAECALALALDSGAALTVLGRSDPDADPELRANLQRMRENGVIVRYLRADLTDRRQVKAAIEQAGPVTAVLHGAGHNEPTTLGDLDTAGFRRALAPKVDGLLAVLESVEPGRLRLLVTFGSIIGEAGLRGEAHYATANEWLADLTRRFAADHPQCHCLCLEWSVWSGVGMGERLSVVESLAREGITAISPDRGVGLLRRLVADPDAPPVVVISGRTGRIDTVRYDLPELPLLRFVAKPLVRYHGVELVTELELNPGTDRYLADHLFEGDMLFPAVLGLEAMAQVAAATLGRTDAPVLEQVGFTRPIGVPPNGGTTIRIAAVVTDDDTVQVVIRSAETGFDAEHFRATVRFGGGPVCDGPPYREPDGLPPLTLDPAADLYGRLLFQGRRFRRLRGYHRLSARRVDADVTAAETDWFAGYLPGELLLGDPGLRDALMHGNQVCVPDATLLPIGIDLVHPGDGRPTAGEFRYSATEREQDGDTYVYDVAVRTAGGQIVERWQGLRLRAARRSDGSGPWTAELLGPYLERALDRVAVVVEPGDGGAEHRAVTALAAGRAVGRRVAVRYRPDGRPETDGGLTISASHGAGLTLCVAAPGTVSCDVETVVERSTADWSALLGGHASVAGLAATEAAESRDLAATRVWAVAECLRKAGSADGAPLAPLPPERPGWVVFATGGFRIATFATAVRNITEPVVFAILREA